MKGGDKQLVIIPSPGKGHLASTVEFARRLLHHDTHGISITILVIPSISPTASFFVDGDDDDRINYINLARIDVSKIPEEFKSAPEKFIAAYIENYRVSVREEISNLITDKSVQIVGLVVDMFCTSMIDVSHEFNFPSYVFFTSSAAFLGLLFYLPIRYDQIGIHFLESEDSELNIPSYNNPVPPSSLPSFSLNKIGFESFMFHAKKFHETKGIFINTFMELESFAVRSLLASSTPPIYTVGPLLDLTSLSSNEEDEKSDRIMKWLDKQPQSSVVFLCFGSVGSFNEVQIKEIALGLERSGHRFIWSVRQSPLKGTYEMPSDFTSYEEILPSGFLERVSEQGLVCGWAPQVKVLAHPAIGGFVSHCGWNSILESLWFGVPIGVWPLYAEQQINAFQLVKDLGLAVEVKLGYRMHSADIVTANDVENAVARLMDGDSEVRKRVKEIREKSRKTVTEGGSSFDSFERLRLDMFRNCT